MKSKIFSILALSIFVAALFISSISALSISTSSLSTFTGFGAPQNLSISNSAEDVNFNTNFTIVSPLTDLNGNNYNFLIKPLGSITNIPSSSQAIYNTSMTSNINNGNFIYGNSYSETVQFNAFNNTLPNTLSNGTINNNTNISSSNVTLNYVKSLCQNGDLNNSNLQMNVYITNEGTGTSTDWKPLDTIQVEVQLENNNNNFNLNNVVFNIGLFQQGTNNNVINNMIWQNGGSNSVQIGSINSNSDGQYTFTFKVDPSILSNENGQTNYILMAEAYGNQFCIDQSPSLSSYGGSPYYTNIDLEIPTYNQAVVVDTSSLPVSTQVSCGQQVTLNPNVYNLGYGGNTYSQNQVLVTLTDLVLGINLNQTIYGGLNGGGSEQVPFTFTIPINATQGIQTLYFKTYYGYNSQYNEPYFNNYQYTSENTFSTILDIQGNCVYATPATTQVTAQLESGGKAGNPLVMQATIENTGNQTVNYNFGLEQYSNWATLSGISPLNITLAPGQSQVITLNLNVDQNVNGNEQFYLDVYSNGYLIVQQPISVSLTSGFFASITGGTIGSNWYIWGIGLLNLIIVIVIIIVLVRVVRKK